MYGRGDGVRESGGRGWNNYHKNRIIHVHWRDDFEEDNFTSKSYESKQEIPPRSTKFG